MARRRKQGRKWGRWILAVVVLAAVAGVGVGRSPKYQARIKAQTAMLAERLDQLVTALRKPTVPDEPASTARPAPSPPAASAPPMEAPIPESDKRKLEKILEPKPAP